MVSCKERHLIVQSVNADMMLSTLPQPRPGPNQCRKKPLTQTEKAQIWRYHKENPHVTHLDIAGTSRQVALDRLWHEGLGKLPMRYHYG